MFSHRWMCIKMKILYKKIHLERLGEEDVLILYTAEVYSVLHRGPELVPPGEPSTDSNFWATGGFPYCFHPFQMIQRRVGRSSSVSSQVNSTSFWLPTGKFPGKCKSFNGCCVQMNYDDFHRSPCWNQNDLAQTHPVIQRPRRPRSSDTTRSALCTNRPMRRAHCKFKVC